MKYVLILSMLALCFGVTGVSYRFINQVEQSKALEKNDYIQNSVTKEIIIQSIDRLSLNLISSDIKVIPTDKLSDSIIIEYKTAAFKNQPYEIIYPVVEEIVSNDLLEIKFKESDKIKKLNNSFNLKIRNNFPFFGISNIHIDKEVSLYVPSSKIFKLLKFMVISGDIKLNDVQVSDLEIQNVSGDIYLNNMQTSVLQLETTSGDVVLEKMDPLLRGKIETISGDINFNSNITLSKSLNFNSISGDINVSNAGLLEVNLLANTMSGDIKMDSVEYEKEIKLISANNDKNVDINTISGDIVIKSN